LSQRSNQIDFSTDYFRNSVFVNWKSFFIFDKYWNLHYGSIFERYPLETRTR
jgi:hypothetical protein